MATQTNVQPTINPGMVSNMMVVRRPRYFTRNGTSNTPTQAPTFRATPIQMISVLLAPMLRRTSPALEFQPSVTPRVKPPREA